MVESESQINFNNLGEIYNFLLDKDEKDLLSSLTPDSLETCLKIAQFYAGESQDKTFLATVAKDTLAEFIQKHTVKEKAEDKAEGKPVTSEESAEKVEEKKQEAPAIPQDSAEKTARDLYQKLHPVYRYRTDDETSGLLSLPREIRQAEILLRLGGRDLARTELVATTLQQDIQDRSGATGMNLLKRIWLGKARSLVAKLDASFFHQRQMYGRITEAQIALHDFEGAIETMKDCKESDRSRLNTILIQETAQTGDFEGAIRMALQLNEEPYVAKKTPYTALDSSKHLFLIAVIQAKKGMQEKALATLKRGEDTLKLGKESINREDIVAGLDFDNQALPEIIFAYAIIGEIKEAEEKASAIIDDKTRSFVRHHLVDFKAKSGDIQGAKDLAKQSHDFINSLIGIAGIQLEANDREGASKTVEEVIGQVVALEKQNVKSVYFNYPDLIRILIRLNNMTSALIFYHKLSSYDAEVSGVTTPLVEGLASNGDIEKVREIANGYREQYGYTIPNQLILKTALICAQKGNLEQAIHLYEDTDKSIRSWVALMQVDAGEFQQAREEMATWVAEFAPDDPYSEYSDIFKRKIRMLAEMVKEQVKRGKIDDALQTIAEMEQLPTETQLSTEVEGPAEVEQLTAEKQPLAPPAEKQPPAAVQLPHHLAKAYHENLAEAYLALVGFEE